MSSVNKVILIGNLGADPELKYTTNSKAVCNLRIATTETWKDKGTGQKQEKTEWHRITVWGDTAENCAKYLAKGRSVYVEGRLETRSYDKDGQKHYATDVVADKVVFLGGGDGPKDQTRTTARETTATTAGDRTKKSSGGRPATAGSARAQSVEDDDIPF